MQKRCKNQVRKMYVKMTSKSSTNTSKWEQKSLKINQKSFKKSLRKFIDRNVEKSAAMVTPCAPKRRGDIRDRGPGVP